MPPDDPAAHQYMHWADGHRGYAHWHKNGDACHVTDWLGYLDLSEEGKLELAQDRAVQLGVLNSREEMREAWKRSAYAWWPKELEDYKDMKGDVETLRQKMKILEEFLDLLLIQGKCDH